MFCKHCGKELKEGAKFCQNCGQALSPNKSVANHSVNHPSEQRGKWTLGKIIKTVFLVGVIIVGFFLKFGLGAIIQSDNNSAEKNNEGLANFGSGNSDQAISDLKKASEDAIGGDTKINTLKNLAYVYSSEGKNTLALQTFKEALPLAESNSFNYYLISGEVALLEGNPELALSSYNKAYNIAPDDFQINNALNLFYLDIEEIAPTYVNYPKALVYAKKAHDNVDDLDLKKIAKENLAIAYFFNEQYDEALSLFLSINSTNKPYIDYWIGLVYLVKEDDYNAKIYLRKAKDGGVELEPELYNYL